ncbi:hypothetical protein M0812_05476 [Anaeramoeba flamelloides]|uniref:Uncharacterized protein n=1 Tax=Anaeramoeba flamelloides TaxID=1746091 RepID=A0AAV8A6T6_9EUKA|nr:hypothetical protein M0812_05476 [Anaeramoeba flamelloides]
MNKNSIYFKNSFQKIFRESSKVKTPTTIFKQTNSNYNHKNNEFFKKKSFNQNNCLKSFSNNKVQKETTPKPESKIYSNFSRPESGNNDSQRDGRKNHTTNFLPHFDIFQLICNSKIQKLDNFEINPPNEFKIGKRMIEESEESEENEAIDVINEEVVEEENEKEKEKEGGSEEEKLEGRPALRRIEKLKNNTRKINMEMEREIQEKENDYFKQQEKQKETKKKKQQEKQKLQEYFQKQIQLQEQKNQKEQNIFQEKEVKREEHEQEEEQENNKIDEEKEVNEEYEEEEEEEEEEDEGDDDDDDDDDDDLNYDYDEEDEEYLPNKKPNYENEKKIFKKRGKKQQKQFRICVRNRTNNTITKQSKKITRTIFESKEKRKEKELSFHSVTRKRKAKAKTKTIIKTKFHQNQKSNYVENNILQIPSRLIKTSTNNNNNHINGNDTHNYNNDGDNNDNNNSNNEHDNYNNDNNKNTNKKSKKIKLFKKTKI